MAYQAHRLHERKLMAYFRSQSLHMKVNLGQRMQPLLIAGVVAIKTTFEFES